MNGVFVKYAELVIPVLVLISTIGFLVTRYYIKEKLSFMEKIQASVNKMTDLHYKCQKNLPLNYTSISEFRRIENKIDNILKITSNMNLIYRTKDESSKDWKALETRLASFEVSIKTMNDSNAERHKETWDKLNRVVDFMRDERNKIENRIEKIEENQMHYLGKKYQLSCSEKTELTKDQIDCS